MPTFHLYQSVVVPSVDMGGVIVAITGDTYTVDFGYGQTQDFNVHLLQPMGA